MIVWFAPFVLSAFISAVTSYEVFIDSQQCHALHTTQFQSLLQDFVSGAPTSLITDKQAFTNYLTERFINNEYPGITITPPVDFSNTTEILLPSLISQYLQLTVPNQELLTQIAIQSILNPGFPIPHPIREDIVSTNILFTEPALTALIDTYLITPSPLLLPHIADLATQFPFYVIPNGLMNELVNRGYLEVDSAATLTKLIPLALASPLIPNLERVLQLSNQFTTVHLPAALVRGMIENTLLTPLQGETYYRRLLADSSISLNTPYLLQQILEYSTMYRNIAIPDSIISLLLQAGLISASSTAVFSKAFDSETMLIELIRQAVISPSSALLQQIAHLAAIFQNVPIPAVIMRQLIISNLISLPRGEALLVSLIQRAQVTATFEILQDIALLYDLFPHIVIPETILRLLMENQLILMASENTFTQIIEQQLTSPTLDSLKQISQLAVTYPDVSVPVTIQNQVGLMNLLNQYIASPNLNVLQDLANGLPTETNFPIPTLLRREINELVASPALLQPNEAKLQSLVLQYLEVPNDSLLDEMLPLIPTVPDFPVPTPIAVVLAQRIESPGLQQAVVTTLTNKLIEEWVATNSEIPLYQLAELNARMPGLPLPESLSNALSPLLRDLQSPSGNTPVATLLELINRYYATQSVQVLNEIFMLAQQFPNFPIPEIIIFQYLIQQYVVTGSIEILRQISIFMFKFQDVVCPEMIVEALITQNVWVTTPTNTRVILHYLIVNHSTTQSYTILKFIYDLFWLHPEAELSVQIVDSLIRYGLLKISQTQYNVQVVRDYLITITKLIKSYQETRSVAILEQIVQIVQVITCYPLPNNIWIDYFVLMYQRTLSKYYLEEIGRRLYLSWSCVIPENVFALVLKENLLLGTVNSEADLMQYIITNYASTSSPYILAAMFHLYQRYSQIDLPENMYNLMVRYGLITNSATETAQAGIESIVQELDELTGLDTSDAVFVFGVLPWRQATLEKLILVTQNRLSDVQAITRDLNNRGVDSALPTYQIISNLVNSILSSANFFVTEADVRASANREFLLNAQLEAESFMNRYISDFGQNFQVSYSGLGRVKGILESFVLAYDGGHFNIAALGEIIRQLLMLDGPLDSIESIFDDLVPLVTLNEGMRATVLESILPNRLESVEKKVLVNQQRLQQLSVLVEETVRTISSNGYQSEAAISQILNSVLALIKSFIMEANSRVVQNRNMFVTISTSGFVISSTDLELFTENLKIAELNLGRAAGAIESVVIAISSGDISVSSIAVIIREILKLDSSIATIESFYDDFLSMPSLSNTVIQSTLSATLPWRIAVIERHFSAVQYRLQDLTVLIQSLIQTSQSDLAQVLTVILNYVTSLTNEANSRLIANREIYQSIVSSNFGINRQQLTTFDDNEKLILLNLGRASGATEAIVLAYLSGQLSVLQLNNVIQVILQLDNSIATVNSVYNDLSVLSSLSVTSNLQVTLITILKHLLGQTGVVQLAGTLSDASSLQSILQSVQRSLLSGAVTGVTSVDDVVALQIILAVGLPGRQATLDKHVIIETQQFNELSVLTSDIILSSIDAGPAYASTATVVEQLMALASQLLASAQNITNQNRQFVSSALKRNFLVSSAELQAFTQNVQVAGGALGRLSGIIEVISQAYNGGAFSINTIGIVLKYVLQFEEMNIDVQQLLEEIEAMDLEEQTRISVLSSLLPWRLAKEQKLITVYQSRLAEVSILTTDIIRTTQQSGFESLLSSIVTTLSAMVQEASDRLLAAQNILQWLSQGGKEETGLASFSHNLQDVMNILGRVEGSIDAIIEAYASGKFTYTSFSVILQSLTTADTTINNIESVYDELSIISSFAVGKNFQTTLQGVLESILGQPTSVPTGTATSAAALRSLLGSINTGMQTQVKTEITSSGDVIALQTILAVTMSSIQSTLEKYLSVTQSRFVEFQTLSSDVQARSLEAGDSYKYLASYISKLISSLTILIDEASVKTVSSRSIVMQASGNGFMIAPGDVRIFVDNMKFAFRNLGRAAGVIEAFVNAYNLGQFRLSTIKFILQSLYKYDETLLSTELEFGNLDTLFTMDDTSRQLILSQMLPWKLALGQMMTRHYTNRLAELQILINGIETSGVSPALLDVVRSIVSYISSIVKELSARQMANENILKYAASRQFAVSLQDIIPIYENTAARASLFGKCDGAIEGLVAAYLAGDFSVNTVTTIVQTLLESDATVGNIESVYDDLSLLSALSVPFSSNLPITLQSIVKNYLGATNYKPYTGVLNEAVGLRSLLGSLSLSLESGLNFNSVTSVSDVVALQTILAVILPARQAAVDKLFLISQTRVQQISTLINDYSAQANDAPTYSQQVAKLLDQLLSSITYMVSDAQVRADENRAFVNRVALKSFLLSSEELQPFISNIQAVEKILGRANGAIDAIVVAYNEGQLTIAKVQLIIQNLLPFDQAVFSIDSIFEELTSSVIVYGASYRPALLAKLLPWRFATIERHCTINKQRIKDLQTLIDDTIIQNANPTITVLLTSVMNLVNSLTQESQASFMIVENSINSIREREYNADDEELLAMTKRVQKIGETLGKAAGTMEAIAVAYNAGEFSVNVVTLIIEQLFQNEVTVTSVETIYDDLAPLVNTVAGTSLQSTLDTILGAHTKTVVAPFGSAADAIALRSVLKNIEDTFTEQYIQSGVSSVNDVVALQTVLAVLLPSRLATLDKFILVTQERVIKLQELVDATITKILESALPSRDGIASLLRGVMTLVQYFNSQAQARASVSRNILNVAISRRFLLTFEEMQPFTENLVVAFDALGRSAGATDALIVAIESGELNLMSLKLIIQTLLQIDDSINLIEGIFSDLESLMVVQGIDLRNILAIILPHRIATLNSHTAQAKERLIEFAILVDDTVAQALRTDLSAYQGLAALLKAILNLVRANIVRASEYAALNDQFLAKAIASSFDVSSIDLKTFTQNVQKAGSALGKSDAAIEVVSVAYRTGELSVNSIQLAIQSLIELDTSVNNVEQLYDTLKSLYLTDLNTRQTALAIYLPWRLAQTEKMIIVNEKRTIALTTLIQSIIAENSKKSAISSLAQSILELVQSYSTEISSRFLASKNVVSWVEASNYNVNLGDLVTFNENELVIWNTLGKIAGVTEALSIAYVAGEFSVNTLELIIQNILIADSSSTTVETIYDDVSFLASLPVGGSLSQTLQLILMNYLGSSSPIEYTGTLNEAAALRSLLTSILASTQVTTEVSTINQDIAIQTIFAVFLPARQALVQKLLLISKLRLEKLIVLVEDYSIQVATAAEPQQAISLLLNSVVSSIRSLIAEAEIRTNENRRIVTSSAERQFFISTIDIQPMLSNVQVALKYLGQVEGAISAVTEAYTSGQLSIKQITIIIEKLLEIEPALSSIGSIYDELRNIILIDTPIRPTILSKLLPWRLATVEAHLNLFLERTVQFKILTDSIVATMPDARLKMLVSSIWTLTSSFSGQAQSGYIALKNGIDFVSSSKFEVSDKQLYSIVSVVKNIADAIGRGEAIIEALSLAYYQGAFTVSTVTTIINDLIKIDTASSSLDQIYDELGMLSSVAVGSNLQSTLNSLLSNLDVQRTSTAFGSTNDALALRSLLGDVNTALSSGLAGNIGVTSVSDVIALQTIFAVMLPARQATLEKFLIVHQTRFDEMKLLVDDLAVQMSASSLPSQNQIVSLLRGIVSLVNYFTSEAKIRATANREALTLAVSRRFFLSSQEYQPFMENLMSAFGALGRAAGGSDALVLAISSGDLSVNSLTLIIETILQSDRDSALIGQVFDDLQPLLSMTGIDQRNILAVLMPARQAVVEKYLLAHEEQVVEFTILINNYVDQVVENNAVAYRTLASLLKGILQVVSQYVTESARSSSASAQVVATAAAKGFDVSREELQSFWQSIAEIGQRLGRAEGAMTAVTVAYNSGELTINTIKLVIKELLQLDDSVAASEGIFSTLESLYALNVPARQSLLSVAVPWRIAATEKLLLVNEGRIKQVQVLIEDIILQSTNANLRVTMQSILNLITSLFTDASARLIANKNILSWISEQNFDVNLNDLVPFNENDMIITQLLGRIAGATEALAMAYASGQFTVRSVNVIIKNSQLIDQTTTQVESLYDGLADISSLAAGSNFAVTLKNLVSGFAGETVNYQGTIDEANAFRALLRTISNGFNTLPTTSMNDVIAFQTILATTLPTRQAFVDKLVLVFQGRVQEFTLLTTDISKKLTESGAPAQAVTTLVNQLTATVNFLFKEVQVRASDNRMWCTAAARRSYLISSAETFTFLKNIEVIEKTLGQISGIIDAISAAYTSGQFSVLSIVTIIKDFRQFDQSVPTIDSIYDELTSLMSFNPVIRQQILAFLLPWRQATVEKHIMINQARTNDLTVLIETIIQSSNQNVIRQLVHSLLSYVVSLTNEANSRAFANKEMLSLFAANNYVVSDQQLSSYTSNVQVVGMTLGRAMGVSEAITFAYVQGDMSFSTVVPIINTMIGYENSIADIESLYDSIEPLFTSPPSGLRQILSSILPSLGSPEDFTLENALDLQSAAKAMAPVSTTAVLSPNDVVGLQVILSVSLPHRQSTLDYHIGLTSQDIATLFGLVNTAVTEYSIISSPSTTQLLQLLRELYSLIALVFDECLTYASASRDFINMAIPRNYMMNSAELQKVVKDMHVSTIALGKATGAVQAALAAFGVGTVEKADISPDTISNIIIQLKNSLLVKESAEEFSAAVEAISQSQLLITAYLENQSLDTLKQISEILATYPNIFLPDNVKSELTRLGYMPGSTITEEIILLRLIEEYKETQTETILSQLIPLLMTYTETKVPLVVVVALINKGVLINSENYFSLVINQFPNYPDETIILISHLISQFPQMPLTLPILERLVRVNYISMTVLDQLVTIWLDTKSPLALQLILEIYQRFPTYSLPIEILDQIYDQTVTTTVTTTTSQLSLVSPDTSELTRPFTDESLLTQLITEYQKFPTETLLLEIDELDRLVPQPTVPIVPQVIKEQISLLRLVQDTVLLPTPSVTTLQQISTMSSQFPVVTIPSSLVEEINLVTWTKSPTPSFEILRKINSVYLLYPNIPIPQSIQEQILLLQLIETSPLTISIIDRITVLSQKYTHLTLSTSITEQISLIQLIKTSPLTTEIISSITALSQTYSSLALPSSINEQISLVQLMRSQPLSESIVNQIIKLSSVYPNIQLPTNIQDLITMQNLIQDIVISRYASETISRQVVSYSQVYNFISLPEPVREIVQLYQLLDTLISGTQSTEILLQIYQLSQLYPKIAIPVSVLQLIQQALQTTSSESTMTATTVITRTTAYTLQEGVTPEDELTTLITEALSSPSLKVIEKIMSLTQTTPTTVVIPSIIRQQIRLVHLINSVATSYSIVESDLLEINALSPSFPHIPVSTPLQEQITLLQLVNEASTCSSSSVALLVRQITQLSGTYPRIAIPTRIQEMVTLVQLIDKVIAQPAPSSYLCDEISTLSLAYPYIQVPTRIQEQSLLQRLIAQAGMTGPSQELLLQISKLSRAYPHVGLPSIMREQIKLITLLQEVSTMSAPAVDILRQISSLSSLYKSIPIPSVIQEQISFVLLIERTVQSTSPSYALIRQIIDYSNVYPHIPVPACLLQQNSLYQLIDELSTSPTVSLETLQTISQLAQAFPFIPVPETVGQQIMLLQLINELNSSPSMILVEEIMHIAPMCPRFGLPDNVQKQVTLVQLIHEVSLTTNPTVQVLQQISTLAQSYSYVTVPTHIQQQITLLQILQSTSSTSSNVYPLLPQIIELSTRFPNIPIDNSYTQLISLHNLVQQVILTPSPLPATLRQLSLLYQMYPNYPMPSSIIQLIQKQSTTTTTTTEVITSSVSSPVSPPVIIPQDTSSSPARTITTVTTAAVSGPVGPVTEVTDTQIILRQLIGQAMQGTPTVPLLQQIASLSSLEGNTPIPTAIQQQLVLLKFIEEATSSLSPTPHLLHQIAGLSATYPYIPIPSVTQQQITLVKLIEEISVAVSPTMSSIAQISTISQMFPHIPIPPYIQQQCVLFNLIQEVTHSTSPSLSVIRQIAQLSTVFPNIAIPQPIQEQITLVDLISHIVTSTTVSINDVKVIKSLSSTYPYVPVPRNVLEIMQLVTLLQSESLSPSEIDQISTLSQSYINIALPTSIQNQILLNQLIREATITAPYTSVSLLVQISQLSPACPNIVLPLPIQEQISLIGAVRQISSSLVFEESTLQIISQLSPTYINIAVPDFIQQYLVLAKLTTSLTPSVTVIQQISQIISSFPVLTVPQVIQEQVRMVQLIEEYTQVSSPSIAVINQIIRLSMLYPHIPLPDSLKQIMVLKQSITEVITQINVDENVIPQIITLSSQYPFIPIPSIVRERIDLFNLINDVSSSPTIVPQTLQQIQVISNELPRVILPAFIAEKREKMEKQNALNDMITVVETTGVVTPESLAQIEELSQFFPEIALPAVVQERIFLHIQETIMQELISEAIATPNSQPILQQIEQLSASLPEYAIPDDVMGQIIEMQQIMLLESIINEVTIATVIDVNHLHEILQLSQGLPSYVLPDFIQQALLLLSLTERIVHAPSTAAVDLAVIQQIIQLTSIVPTFAIPAPVQKLIDLFNLVQQVQLSPSPLDNLEPLLQIAEISQALPNFVIPSSVVQLVTSAKNTVQLRNLIQIAQTGKPDISTIQQIAQLAPSLPNVPLPLPIQQQVTLVQLIQKSQSGTPGSDVVKQLTELSKLYPSIPLPSNVRQLIAPSPVPTMAKVSPTNRVSENQLKQYVSMYERMPSSMILRQIANVLPNIAEPVLPEKIMTALVQQGLVPADSFPQVQLQQLIQQYQASPSPAVIQQITQLANNLPGVTLPSPVQQAVSIQRAESLYNELAPLFATEPATATILDRGTITLRQDSFDRQIELSEGYLDMARQVMRQLMENVRASGHPMHRATFSAFEAVLDLISHLINEARTAVEASRQQIMVGGEVAVSTLASTSLTVQDLLGRAEGARQALLKEAKEFSASVIESSDRVISAAQSTKNKMESVFNDLLTQSTTFARRSARSVRRT